MLTNRVRSSRTAVVMAATVVIALAAPASAAPQVIQDPAQFAATTGAVNVPFPADADTALPLHPFDGLVGYSCTEADEGIELGEVTVRALPPVEMLCFIDADWNAGGGNITPQPTSLAIIGNGEDDYVLTFDDPVNALGLGLLTNASAQETLTVTAPDGSTNVVEDPALGTAPNAFEFVGLTAPEGMSAVTVDTTGGRLQNTGITSIAIARTPRVTEVRVDIKPGNAQNTVNPKAKGVLPVAVLSANGFDARTIDPRSVRLEGAPARARGKHGKVGRLRDVDHDGDLDLVLHFGNLSVLAGKTRAELTGTTRAGMAIHGSDHIRIVGNGKH